MFSISKSRFKTAHLFFLIFALLLHPRAGLPAFSGPLHSEISGEFKSINFFTMTTGLNPELADQPFAMGKRGAQVFENLERARLKLQMPYDFDKEHQMNLKLYYDHQSEFGSFVGTGDYRLNEKWQEDRQFLDLSQTMVEEKGIRYLHRLYRASLSYRSPLGNVEVGRQQIPWGKGHFFTPTDIFNPFMPTQIELEERQGVDAVHLTAAEYHQLHGEFVYTPRGKCLHPQRMVGRVTRDIEGYEVGVLGGSWGADYVGGGDFEGNLGNAVLRGEGLFHESSEEANFFKYTLNLDYNFPRQILAGLEYHYNGQGRRKPQDYQLDRFAGGEIQQLGKDYGGLFVQHEVNSILKVSNRFLMNMNDVSFFVRPEVQYEMFSNFYLTGAVLLYLGNRLDEFGQGQNLYFMEARYSF